MTISRATNEPSCGERNGTTCTHDYGHEGDHADESVDIGSEPARPKEYLDIEHAIRSYVSEGFETHRDQLLAWLKRAGDALALHDASPPLVIRFPKVTEEQLARKFDALSAADYARQYMQRPIPLRHVIERPSQSARHMMERAIEHGTIACNVCGDTWDIHSERTCR